MDKEDLILFLPPFLWGWTFIIVKNGVSNYDPLSFIFIRFLFSIIFLIPLIYYFKVKITKNVFLKGFTLGFFLFFAYLFQTIGLKYTSPSNSAFITSISIIITPFFNFFISKTKIKIQTFFAIILCLIGLYFLFGGNFQKINIGDILTFICAIFWALHISFIGHFSLSKESLAFLFVQFWVVYLFSSISILLTNKTILPIPKNSLLGSFIVAIFATIFPFYIQIKHQTKENTIKTAFIFSTEPIFANLLEVIFLGPIYKIINYIGMILIFLSSLIAQRD